MTTLSRDQILGLTDDLRTDTAELPDGSLVRVRELTADEVERLGFSMMEKSGELDARRARGQNTNMILWATLDQDGNRVFTKNDEAKVKSLSWGVTKAIAGKIMELSNLGKASEERLHPVTCPHCSEEFEVDLTALLDDYETAQVGDEAKN